MTTTTAGLGGYARGIGAGLLAAAVLVLGAWIGSQRATAPDGPEQTAPSAALQPSQDAGTTGETAATTPVTTAPEAPSAPSQTAVPTAPETPAAPQQTTPQETATTPDFTTEDTTDPPAAATTVSPRFDEVRREPDGMTVIAGRAAPGARIEILMDGVAVATTTADAVGKFATIAMLAPDGKGHVLSLLQDDELRITASDDEIILAPAAPLVVAEAQPAASAPDAGASQPVAEVPTVAAVPTPRADATPGPSDSPATDPTMPPATGDADTRTSDTPSVDPLPTEAARADEQPSPTPAATAETEPRADVAPTDSATPVPAPTGPALAPGATATTALTAPSAFASDAASTGVQTPAPIADAPDLDAPARVAVLKSTAEGIEVLQPAAPQVMTNVALDTISYSETGDVQLSGRAQSQASEVRVYLDNDAVITLPVDDKGRWRGDLPDVDEGIYTLRVDEVSADGTVSSRVETPFKRESATVLAEVSARADAPISAVTVQKGDTLWAISRDRYGDPFLYVRVFEANSDAIRDPDLIYPGQVFDLPEQ